MGDDIAPAAPPTAAQARDAALDQRGLTHLVGYAATRASLELKKSFRRHLGPLKLKAVEWDSCMAHFSRWETETTLDI